MTTEGGRVAQLKAAGGEGAAFIPKVPDVRAYGNLVYPEGKEQTNQQQSCDVFD